MNFVYGFMGALACLVLLVVGGVTGWLVCKAVTRHSKPDLPKPEEQERKRLVEEQKAFRQMQNYSTERAYGMLGGEDGW